MIHSKIKNFSQHNDQIKTTLLTNKHLDLYIVNGRCGDDKDVGKTTSKNVITVDYCIVTRDIFEKIEQFQV